MKDKFKFKPDDLVIWENKKARVVSSWFDGMENRCSIYISLKSHRGDWIVRESSLEFDNSVKSDT